MAAVNANVAHVKKRIDRAQDIITADDHFPRSIYDVAWKREEHRPATAYRKAQRPATIIDIANKDQMHHGKLQGNYCLRCKIFDDDLSTLHIALLTRCGLYGSEHLTRLIAFSNACGFLRITLEDHSKILYDTHHNTSDSDYSINLQQLQRLMTGESWYEKFGFTNKAIEESRKRIDAYLTTPIGSIYPEEIVTRLHRYAADITPDTPVSKAVTHLYRYLQALCPKRVCAQKDLTHVDQINGLLHELYQEMLLQLHMNEDDFIGLELIIPQKGSSRTRKSTRRRRRQRTRRV